MTTAVTSSLQGTCNYICNYIRSEAKDEDGVITSGHECILSRRRLYGGLHLASAALHWR